VDAAGLESIRWQNKTADPESGGNKTADSVSIGQHEYHEPGYISFDNNKIKFGLLGNIEKEIFHNLIQFASLSILSHVVVQAGNMV